MTKDEMKCRISMALKDPTLQQGFEIICKNLSELEKENTELKDDNKVMADNYSKMEQKFFDNLAEAKKIIKYLLSFIQKENFKTRWDINIAEAEQFIKED